MATADDEFEAAVGSGNIEKVVQLLCADHALTARDKNLLAAFISTQATTPKRRRGAPNAKLFSRTYYVRQAAEDVRRLIKAALEKEKPAKISQELAVEFLAPWWGSNGYKLKGDATDPQSVKDKEAVLTELRRAKPRSTK